ncbi:TolC family protein [Cupriavidus pauculus]|uniref:TolC family protein n=1 Tax=Cupriavidus pauculus TaxID=82633 RepID=UPI0019110559
MSLGLTYEIDFWGKNRATIAAAVGREKAAEVDYQAARLMLATAVVRTYLQLDALIADKNSLNRSITSGKPLWRLPVSA